MNASVRTALIKVRQLLKKIDEAHVSGESARELLAEAHRELEQAAKLHALEPSGKLTTA